MHCQFYAGEGLRAFALFHGTGGDESSLVPIAQELDANAPILAFRGEVLENGANRFFRRFAEGVFDLDDVLRRTVGLSTQMADLRDRHELRRVCALGYSNGANMAAATLLCYPDAFDEAILIRAQSVLPPADGPSLEGKRVLILSGNADPIVPLPDASDLAQSFRNAGAETTHRWIGGGHNLRSEDFEEMRRWLS